MDIISEAPIPSARANCGNCALSSTVVIEDRIVFADFKWHSSQKLFDSMNLQ